MLSRTESKTEKYDTERKIKQTEKTIFAPDFLVVSENEIFFAETKYKTKKAYLGMVNVRDYEKYLKMMRKLRCLGFKIFFYVEETEEIYVLEKLLKPNFPTKRYYDGEVYQIPESELKLVYSEG